MPPFYKEITPFELCLFDYVRNAKQPKDLFIETHRHASHQNRIFAGEVFDLIEAAMPRTDGKIVKSAQDFEVLKAFDLLSDGAYRVARKIFVRNGAVAKRGYELLVYSIVPKVPPKSDVPIKGQAFGVPPRTITAIARRIERGMVDDIGDVTLGRRPEEVFIFDKFSKAKFLEIVALGENFRTARGRLPMTDKMKLAAYDLLRTAGYSDKQLVEFMSVTTNRKIADFKARQAIAAARSNPRL